MLQNSVINSQQSQSDADHIAVVKAARKAGFTYFDEPNCESEVGMLLEFAKEIRKSNFMSKSLEINLS